MARYKVKAILFGTAVGVDGTIYHFNPKGSDPAAKEPVVDQRDLPMLIERKLIADDTTVDKLGDPIPEGRLVYIPKADPVAAKAVGDIAIIDDESPAVAGTGPAGNEAIVHYDQTQGVGAGSDGIAAGDVDAAPEAAPAKRGRGAAAAGS